VVCSVLCCFDDLFVGEVDVGCDVWCSVWLLRNLGRCSVMCGYGFMFVGFCCI